MSIREALKIALSNEIFRDHYNRVTEAYRNKTQSSCMIFAIDGRCFYYGFDGFKIQCGKHTPKRSQYLINKGEALIIR